MPTVQIRRGRLVKLLGTDISEEKLSELLFSLKAENKKIGEDIYEVEVNSDRPDLFISEGIARAAKGLLGAERGIFRERTHNEDLSLTIEEVKSRPYIYVATVRNIALDEDGIRELIQLQEKLHVTVGRKRRKVAIGLHDLDKIPNKTLTYRYAKIKETMLPLYGSKLMTIEEVLKKTEQGLAYGKLSLDGIYHPAIYAGDEIISLPPVINSDITRITPETRNLLIDVTGTDKYAVRDTINVIVSVLNENPGTSIGKIEVHSEGTKVFHPELGTRVTELEISFVEKILGFSLNADEITRYLEKMRFGVLERDEQRLKIEIPAYRIDIMHPVDLVEDIAMAYGYNRIPLNFGLVTLEGHEDKASTFDEVLKEILIGLGFQETYTFILGGEELKHFVSQEASLITLKNPVVETMKYVRAMLIPALLNVLRESQHRQLPIKVFEIGEAGVIEKGELSLKRSIAMAVMDDEISFEDIQAPAFSLLRYLGLEPKTRKSSYPYLIDGRSAKLYANDIPLGVIGEVHPKVLVAFEVKHPVAVAELDLQVLEKIVRST